MEQWRTKCLSGGGESKASSSMENKVLRPFLCLVVVLRGHGYGLVRALFLLTSFWMLVGFVFSHDKFDEGNDGFGDVLNDGKFINFVCERSDYPSFAKGLGFNFPPSEIRMTVVDGEMAVFVHIGVLLVAYPFGMVILDGEIYGFFKVSCLPSMELALFGWLI
ncbi:hypothetical protein EJB05_22953, partial [Eragrostis curvula]